MQLKFHEPIGILIPVKKFINHKFKPINHEDYLFWAGFNCQI